MTPRLPQHLGIIMDGNRRWAKARHLSALEGHRAGYETFKKIADYCYDLKIKILSIFAFSTENWQRPKAEVNFLMKLLDRGIGENVPDFIKKGVAARFIGSRENLSAAVCKSMDEAASKTSHGQNGILNIAINYGGHNEILRAVQKIAAAGLSPDQISEKTITDALDTASQPDPDLIIRTSGEQRLSGFLPWQSVYSELYFSPKLWPDFTTQDLDAALADYTSRQRRFGGS